MEDCNLSGNFIKIEWNIEKTLLLIELWEQHPCLYDRKSRQYNNKRARYAALTNIANSLKELIPNITPEYVKIKINNLRTQYNHELVKKNKSMKNSSDTEDVYQPSAYWYNKISFLKRFIQTRQKKSDSASSENVAKQENESSDPLDEVTVSIPSKKKKMDDDEVFIKASNVMTSSVASSLKKRSLEYPDTIETFGEYVKAELNLIKNEDLRDDAVHEIMNILYQYKKKQRNISI